MKRKLRAAILGFGGIGHCHANSYKGLKNVELVALCDINPRQLESAAATINLGDVGGADVSSLRTYLSYEDLVKAEKGKVDIIDCCLPAYLHAEYVKRAMADGFDVLSEKPMALSTRDCLSILAAQKETGRAYMVAQCLRFSPDYAAIADLVRTQAYGRLLRLDMERVSAYPSWDSGWYMDAKKSGGAVLDLHLHDLDWVQSAFGLPASLTCHGLKGRSGGYDDVLTYLDYGKKGPGVSIHGSWMAAEGFHSTFSAKFEKAVLHSAHGKLTLTDYDGKELPFQYKPANMYAAEIEYFAGCIRRGQSPDVCLPVSTARSVALVEAERLSARANGKPILRKDLAKGL